MSSHLILTLTETCKLPYWIQGLGIERELHPPVAEEVSIFHVTLNRGPKGGFQLDSKAEVSTMQVLMFLSL